MENLEEIILKELASLTERGFSYSSLYEKSSDSACVYIYRFSRGAEYMDIRTIIGSGEYNVSVYTGGRYRFPSLKAKFKKEWRGFKMKHLFKRANEAETLSFVCSLIAGQAATGDLFGIKL